MFVADYPPSLRVTPGKIKRYLARSGVKCTRCGYSLRGLEEPRCPECGVWTDISERVFRRNLQNITNRVGPLGTIDGYIVERLEGRIDRAIHFDDIKGIEVMPRWTKRKRSWVRACLMILAMIGIGMLVCGVIIGAEAWPWPIVGVFMAIGAVLAGLISEGLEPEWFVLVHADEDTFRIPMWNCFDEVGIHRAVAIWLKIIEEHRPGEPTDGSAATSESEEVDEEGSCPRCGYSLGGPQLMVASPTFGAQVAGVLLIILGVILTLCGGALGFEILGPSTDSEFIVFWLLMAVFLGMILLGVWLIRLKLKRPAVPSWTGDGDCSACGWEPDGQTG